MPHRYLVPQEWKRRDAGCRDCFEPVKTGYICYTQRIGPAASTVLKYLRFMRVCASPRAAVVDEQAVVTIHTSEVNLWASPEPFRIHNTVPSDSFFHRMAFRSSYESTCTLLLLNAALRCRYPARVLFRTVSLLIVRLASARAERGANGVPEIGSRIMLSPLAQELLRIKILISPQRSVLKWEASNVSPVSACAFRPLMHPLIHPCCFQWDSALLYR